MRKISFHPKIIRNRIYKLLKEAKASHIGCALSCVEILMAIRKCMGEGDEFILSKGHAISCWYAINGVESMIDLPRMATRGSYINVSSGSLGHGLSIACGWALANRDKNVFVVLGDGECQEGQVWEALMFAAHHNLKNVRLIIDHNRFQACGHTKDILNLYPLDKKIHAFGWNVRTAYGHDLDEMIFLFRTLATSDIPTAIIACTTKGKGFPEYEDNNLWHYKNPE